MRLKSVINNDANANPVIEFLIKNLSNTFNASYIYINQDAAMFFSSPSDIVFLSGYQEAARFNTLGSLVFSKTTSNVQGSITSNHPEDATNKINKLYATNVVCDEVITEKNIRAYKAFQSRYGLSTIQGFSQDVPAPNRIAMLELGVSQAIASANNLVYPIMRLNCPVADAEWYSYVQSNTDGNEYFGWAFSDTFSPQYFLELDSGGSINCYEFLIASGGLSASAPKTFRISHPIKAEAEKNKILYHNTIEAPRCDNLYSGKIQLVNGKATVNLDNNEWYIMTSGTFNKLNKDFRIYVNNNDFDNWDLVKGKIEGNKLIIISNNPKSNIIVDWIVIGTRKDQDIIDSHLTDEFGNLITEHIELETENVKMKKNKAKINRKERNDYNKFHSIYKRFSNRLDRKTRINNGLHTAQELIKTNPDKKKEKKIKNEDKPFIYYTENYEDNKNEDNKKYKNEKPFVKTL